MAARRVIDPRQQGSRISWDNDLFQQVERVQLPAYQPPAQLPAPDVNYLTVEDWDRVTRNGVDVTP